MDIHHVINKQYSIMLIPAYQDINSISLALPQNQHYLLSKYRKKNFTGMDDLIHSELEA